MKHVLATAAFLLLLTVCATPAQAGTFCVAGAGLPLQCLYEDPAECAAAASSPEASCTVNPEAQLSYVGGARYCEVGAARIAQCLYADRSQCDATAGRSHAVCFDRTVMADSVNPYRYDPRVQN